MGVDFGIQLHRLTLVPQGFHVFYVILEKRHGCRRKNAGSLPQKDSNSMLWQETKTCWLHMEICLSPDATPLHPQQWLLRWRFDFATRPSVYGHWGRAEENIKGMAAFQVKEGMIRASIEGKRRNMDGIKVFAECDGWDYCVFKWMAIARLGGFRIIGEITPPHYSVGLALLTREKKIEVYATGDVITSLRPEDEKGIQYATYGATANPCFGIR